MPSENIFGGCDSDVMKLLAYAAVIAALLVALVLLWPSSEGFDVGMSFADPYPAQENVRPNRDPRVDLLPNGRRRLNEGFDVGMSYADPYPAQQNMCGGGGEGFMPKAGQVLMGNGDNFDVGMSYADPYPAQENFAWGPTKSVLPVKVTGEATGTTLQNQLYSF